MVTTHVSAGVISSQAGASVRHSSVANGQRRANRQAAGLSCSPDLIRLMPNRLRVR